MKYAHETPKGKPHFRYTGMVRDGVELYFLQKGFNITFKNQFGSDKPDKDGYDILFSEFDECREYSKQQNPDYETSIDDKLTLLQSAIQERLDCPITRGMRIAYEDVIELIEEVRS
jgi:hypothetical protein